MGDGNGVETAKILYIHVWNGQSINKTNFLFHEVTNLNPSFFFAFNLILKIYFLINSFVPIHDVVIVFGPYCCRPPNSGSCSPLRLPATHFAAFVTFIVAFWVLLESLAWTRQGFYCSVENSPCTAPWRKMTPPPPSLGQGSFWLHCRDSSLAKG